MYALEWSRGAGRQSWSYLALPSTNVLFLSTVIFLAWPRSESSTFLSWMLRSSVLTLPQVRRAISRNTLLR